MNSSHVPFSAASENQLECPSRERERNHFEVDPGAVLRRSMLTAISLEFAFRDPSERDVLPSLAVVEQDNSQET